MAGAIHGDGFRLVSARVAKGAWVITVAGELDAYRSPELERELARASAGGNASVVVDLSETTFVDSTALGVLLACAGGLRSEERPLVLVTGAPALRRVFGIAGVDRHLQVEPTLSRALAFPRLEPLAT